MAQRILTTHTGSLPRPAELNRLYVRRQRGEAIDDTVLANAVAEAVRTAVNRQKQAGIDVGNDGEQQREAYFLYMQRRLSGLGGSWTRPPLGDVMRYPAFAQRMREFLANKEIINGREGMPMAVGEVRYIGDKAVAEECSVLRTVLDEMEKPFADAFLTAPSPGIVAAGMRNNFYPDEKFYLDALADALRNEYEAIVAAGFILQVDCPDLGVERHVTFEGRPLAEFLRFAEDAVAALNSALKNVPRQRVRMHVCWGNYEGPHDKDVALADIFPVIQQAEVGGFVLPFANPRHGHEVRCLKQLREGRYIVAGVIDPLTNFVEHPELVAERIERVAEMVGDPSRVMAGVDCGFDSAAGAGRVADDVVWAKLSSLRQGADIASQRLFATQHA